jgi:hypothetical protein
LYLQSRTGVEITLWTNDVLVFARRIYEAADFRLVQEEPHRTFGQDLVGQYWELAVSAPIRRRLPRLCRRFTAIREATWTSDRGAPQCDCNSSVVATLSAAAAGSTRAFT